MTADELRVRKAEISTSQLVFYAPVEELSVFCSSLGGMLDQANLRNARARPGGGEGRDRQDRTARSGTPTRAC